MAADNKMELATDVKELYTIILQEHFEAVRMINKEQTEALIACMISASRIFFAGSGRSGLIVKAFAMRCMQMGLKIFVVGETVTPAIKSGDLLLIGSGSGETSGLVQIAKKAKSVGAKIGLVTIRPESSLGALADCIVSIPGRTIKTSDITNSPESVQPAGNLFEQGMFLLFESISLKLMPIVGVNNTTLFENHANLE
ncbi:MAG: 6-phospho-3-hexuloisomerase [Oscillospiraceae bacterium]|nr:6-phospho-3-hexuloisomerase [Oscillospiraceae bacterium]